MREEDYPALYRAADNASNESQASLLYFHKINITLLICAAITALMSAMTTLVAILSAAFFLGSLLVYVYGQHQNFLGRWYQARALAESVKTATWRLMMSAEPFGNVSKEVNLQNFRNLLNELLQSNKGIGAYLCGDWAQMDQVTPKMTYILDASFDEKRQLYLHERIDNQRKWYAKKSGDNREASKRFFWLLCGVYSIAIVLLLVRIAAPETPFLPIDVFAVIASSIIGWAQIKRFDELASAYGLTAHEVGIVKSRYENVNDSEHLSCFVSDAENAFSREHTQWAARRDH